LLADVVIGGGINLEAAFVEPVTGLSMNPARSVSPAMVSGLLSAIWIYLMATTLEAVYMVFTDGLPKVRSAAQTNP